MFETVFIGKCSLDANRQSLPGLKVLGRLNGLVPPRRPWQSLRQAAGSGCGRSLGLQAAVVPVRLAGESPCHPEGTVPRPGAFRFCRSLESPDTRPRSTEIQNEAFGGGRTHSPGAALPSFFLAGYKRRLIGATICKATATLKRLILNRLNRYGGETLLTFK